jgi:hypothetical protein
MSQLRSGYAESERFLSWELDQLRARAGQMAQLIRQQRQDIAKHENAENDDLKQMRDLLEMVASRLTEPDALDASPALPDDTVVLAMSSKGPPRRREAGSNHR